MHGDDQDLAGQLRDLLFQLNACFFVKASRRFVQHDKASLAPERPGQVEPALFAAGKGVLLAADLRVHGRAALGIPFGKSGIRKRLCQRLVLLRRTGEHGEIVADGGAVDKGFLG